MCRYISCLIDMIQIDMIQQVQNTKMTLVDFFFASLLDQFLLNCYLFSFYVNKHNEHNNFSVFLMYIILQVFGNVSKQTVWTLHKVGRGNNYKPKFFPTLDWLNRKNIYAHYA